MATRPTKYIFITGGVVSSLGKGLTCASLGALLESRGLRVSICKCDPYLNVDPGTMSPNGGSKHSGSEKEAVIQCSSSGYTGEAERAP